MHLVQQSVMPRLPAAAKRAHFDVKGRADFLGPDTRMHERRREDGRLQDESHGKCQADAGGNKQMRTIRGIIKASNPEWIVARKHLEN